MSQDSNSSFKYDLQQSIKPKLAPLGVAVTSALAAGSLQAATITVNSLNDGFVEGECTLRSAVYASTSNLANEACTAGSGDDTIVFDPSLTGTIQLLAGAAAYFYGSDDSSIAIGESVTINGDDRITVRGTGNGGVFQTKYYNTPFPSYRAESVTFSNITITNGGGEQRGGAIASRARYLTLSNVTLADNSAAFSGAGIHHEPAYYYASKSLVIENSTFSNNSVVTEGSGGYAGGAGVYAQLGTYGGTVVISDSDFEGNTALIGHGGAVHLQSEDITYLIATNNSFNGNQAAATSGSGGALFANVGYVTADIVGNTFVENSSTSYGGALYLRESNTDFQLAQIQMRDNIFTYNLTAGRGGGAFVYVTDGSNGTIENPEKFVNLDNEFFSANESGFEGGGLFLDLGDTVNSTITGSSMLSNASQLGVGGTRIRAQNGRVLISDTQILYNTAYGGNTGGMSLFGPGTSFGLENMEFIGNRTEYAYGSGGGLTLSPGGGESNVSSSTFRNNYAVSQGGGVWVSSGSPDSSSIEFKDVEISGNAARGQGGGLNGYLGPDSQLIVSNSTLSGNESLNGRGGGAYFNGSMTVELNYSTIANNTAAFRGGGVYNRAATCRVSDTVFGGNTGNAYYAGGSAQDVYGPVLCEVTDSLLASASSSQFTDNGGNLLDVDPQLNPLSDNGGPTRTHALQPDSPAIDAGTAGLLVPDFDQRGVGFPRIVGGILDMGAFELRRDDVFSDRFQQTPP